MSEMNEAKVCVLMSTYNGERFLSQQLKSIYAQQGVNVSILVRDDGSSDSTQDILKREAEAKRLEWYAGENVKPARSFMDLIDKAACRADLYAFSDQDDVWKNDKLLAAAAKIGNADCPAIYMCQTQLVDENLQPLSRVNVSPMLTFGEALIYQYASGCTMVFNESLRQIISSYKPHYIFMHDMWILCVAFAVGAKVVFDNKAYVMYRQHQSNVIGETASKCKNWEKRIRRIRRNERIRSRTVIELLNGYGEIMTEDNLQLAQNIADYRTSWQSKLKLIFCPRLWSAKKSIGLTSRIAILLNRF